MSVFICANLFVLVIFFGRWELFSFSMCYVVRYIFPFLLSLCFFLIACIVYSFTCSWLYCPTLELYGFSSFWVRFLMSFRHSSDFIETLSWYKWFRRQISPGVLFTYMCVYPTRWLITSIVHLHANNFRM